MSRSTKPPRQWRGWLRRRAAHLTIDPVERQLGGRAGGLLWLAGGLALASYSFLPSVVHHDGLLYAMAACGAAWGFAALLIDWRTANPLITHASTLGACASVAVAVAATGGARSAAWTFLFWVALFCCYFYRPPLAILYTLLCALTQAVPVLYAPGALHGRFLAELITADVGYIAIGGCVIAGKRIMQGTRMHAESLAAEQGALQRAATAVLRGEQPARVFQIVSAELAAVVRAPLASVFELSGEDELTVVGNWSDDTVGSESVGTRLVFRPQGAFAESLATGRVVRSTRIGPAAPARLLGCGSTLVAPVRVDGKNWGAIALGSRDEDGFKGAEGQYLAAFARLVEHIVESLADRARLEAEALTDQLTGLANHRALHQRLASEAHRAQRHGRILSVAMIDVDNFKEINDLGGHDRGDDALRAVADCLRSVVRAEDTVGRLGGDEFMWIMPDTDGHQALMAVERARDLIAAAPIQPKRATTSAGIADAVSTFDPAELVRRADIALYNSKASGRNLATLYDADVATGVATRVDWFERSQALVGLRALARAIDAKDPATSEHSERVAAFAGRLAKAVGWQPELVARLREAALVHDVGKLGVPDAILTKPGRLTDAEREQMNQHAEMSARIVGGVLTDEQVSWILAHHERPDGRGYPSSLTDAEIPEGAALIALADAWDVMVAGRPYSQPKSLSEAFDECVGLVGAQFTETAVRALIALRETDWPQPDRPEPRLVVRAADPASR